jgi:hypothetical protein
VANFKLSLLATFCRDNNDSLLKTQIRPLSLSLLLMLNDLHRTEHGTAAFVSPPKTTLASSGGTSISEDSTRKTTLRDKFCHESPQQWFATRAKQHAISRTQVEQNDNDNGHKQLDLGENSDVMKSNQQKKRRRIEKDDDDNGAFVVEEQKEEEEPPPTMPAPPLPPFEMLPLTAIELILSFLDNTRDLYNLCDCATYIRECLTPETVVRSAVFGTSVAQRQVIQGIVYHLKKRPFTSLQHFVSSDLSTTPDVKEAISAFLTIASTTCLDICLVI